MVCQQVGELLAVDPQQTAWADRGGVGNPFAGFEYRDLPQDVGIREQLEEQLLGSTAYRFEQRPGGQCRDFLEGVRRVLGLV